MPDQSADRTPRVVLAVPTFRRNDQLTALLPALVGQADSAAADVGIVVVDNDPDSGARSVVNTWAGASRIRYVHEPRPGLAAVRNRLLDEAEGADAVVFIDDDELPGPDWLLQLLDAWTRYRCAAVVGPVRSIFDVEPEPWITATGVFDRQRRETGTSLRGGASNNLLLDLNWLRTAGLRFDPAFGASGGEDTMLTHAIVAAGGMIRWCDEAEVTERVPAARMTRGWISRRIVRSSNSWSRVELKVGALQGRPWRSRAAVAARVPYFALSGFGKLGAGAVRRDRTLSVRGKGDLYRAAGVARAVLGLTDAEYLRSAPHMTDRDVASASSA